MKYPTFCSHGFLLIGLITLSGCFSLAREEPPQVHYVLGGNRPQQDPAPAERLTGFAVGIRPPKLAAYLESPLIVVRQGSNQIRYAEFFRWGEELGGGINRVVAGYLAEKAPVRSVDVVPWPVRTHFDYLIQLHLARFEGLAPEEPTATRGEACLLATWEIIRPLDGVVLARGTTDYRERTWTVGDYDGLITLLDRGLDELSNDLASRLELLAAP